MPSLHLFEREHGAVDSADVATSGSDRDVRFKNAVDGFGARLGVAHDGPVRKEKVADGLVHGETVPS